MGNPKDLDPKNLTPRTRSMKIQITENDLQLTQPMDPEKKSLNFIFPTKYVIPKSLKFSHWPSKANLSRNFRDTPTLLLHSSKTEEMNHWYFLRKKTFRIPSKSLP